jgi:hypothetical protein
MALGSAKTDFPGRPRNRVATFDSTADAFRGWVRARDRVIVCLQGERQLARMQPLAGWEVASYAPVPAPG